ncbi:MAG: hypothetical protein U1F58_08200 [Burkholderiales bacterium]
MGFLGNMLTGGKGIAGANNAHLAEFVIARLTAAEKKRVAEKVIEMGIQASGYRETAASFKEFFRNHERLSQLNCVALALAHLGFQPGLSGETWMMVANPFMVPTDAKDLEANAGHFRRKHHVNLRIGTERIDLGQWGA